MDINAVLYKPMGIEVEDSLSESQGIFFVHKLIYSSLIHVRDIDPDYPGPDCHVTGPHYKHHSTLLSHVNHLSN